MPRMPPNHSKGAVGVGADPTNRFKSRTLALISAKILRWWHQKVAPFLVRDITPAVSSSGDNLWTTLNLNSECSSEIKAMWLGLFRTQPSTLKGPASRKTSAGEESYPNISKRGRGTPPSPQRYHHLITNRLMTSRQLWRVVAIRKPI